MTTQSLKEKEPLVKRIASLSKQMLKKDEIIQKMKKEVKGEKIKNNKLVKKMNSYGNMIEEKCTIIQKQGKQIFKLKNKINNLESQLMDVKSKLEKKTTALDSFLLSFGLDNETLDKSIIKSETENKSD